MGKSFVILGSLNAFLAVSLGAFGAHGLKPVMSAEMFAVYQTGVNYHLFHALGLLIISVLVQLWTSSRWVVMAGWFLLAGIILFSGSLYVLSLTGVHYFGVVTPIGGSAFLVGWLLLLWAGIKA
ncbi:DUF423 domain-containing protein [Beggiatoa leptomitoformis]|uniref:DUF423 domain-containing protein n=1 Tax=Beggiatoa leptomitoformis TaxID=288004 RepID=A0A2N9YBM6_9GAMM|nr:DUF423 domain-containing protein [Beggiatoa leptomitoformis]ALG66759.1 DUF423 domain-containing protein [Beggiatoa leptomitoformis]AUI67898.1 DUF423 domain-containing protein [Beggiatoa leptomitoformis]